MKKKPLLLAVVGPTAIGKTTLAIALAKAFNTEIVSADSRQFYKEMKIGTAVPTRDELKAAPHHFIQNRSIFEDYNVGDYERDALACLDLLFEQNKDEKCPVVILVGGSGLYVNAVTKGLDHFPDIIPGLRDALNLQLEEEGIQALQEELQNADPKSYKTIDIHNPTRVIRALEVYKSSGKPFSYYLNQTPAPRSFDVMTIGLSGPREEIYERINARVDLMMQEGLLEEAKSLYPFRTQNALQTVGYKELFNYLDGAWDLEFAISEIKKNSRRFAKRQLTWFRKNSDTHWFDYKIPSEEILEAIQKAIQEKIETEQL